MAIKKSAKPKAAAKKSVLITIAGGIGHLAGTLVSKKNHLVEKAAETIDSVKESIHNITTTNTDAVKAIVKKAAPKKAAPKKAAAKKAAAKKAAPKKAVKGVVKKAAKAVKKIAKAAPVKKVVAKKAATKKTAPKKAAKKK